MLNIELVETVLAVIGVVMVRFLLFLTVVFIMAIPIAIAVHGYQLIRRLVTGAPAAAAAGHGEGAVKVPR